MPVERAAVQLIMPGPKFALNVTHAGSVQKLCSYFTRKIWKTHVGVYDHQLGLFLSPVKLPVGQALRLPHHQLCLFLWLDRYMDVHDRIRGKVFELLVIYLHIKARFEWLI